jgi:NADPH:quinone reductase-like Zn-dependent oxidoreductase
MAIAVIFNKIGGPEVLQLVDRGEAIPGDGEVLVEMRAVGVNRADVAFRTGKYLVKPTPPCGLGVEGAGIIAALGAGVSHLNIGDRVCILPSFLQGGRYATYLTRGVFPASSLIPAPEKLDDIGASAIWVSFLTSWGALVELGGLGRGDYVLISAASSSVGLAAIQVASILGAIPIATTRTNTKAQALRDVGAAHVIVSEEENVPATVQKIVGTQGLRLAFDPIAGPFAESLVPCMREEGTIFIYGGLSDQPTLFDRRPILAKELSLTGYTVGQILKRPDRLKRGRAFVEAGLTSGRLSPVISRVFSLEDVVDAHRYMEKNSHIGKIVLKTARGNSEGS